MSKIAILTDSACDIPPELERKYGIDILCFSIMLDGKSYTERKDFSFEEYYDLLRNAKGIPSTAHVTHLAFCEQYCKYVDEGYTEVLHVTINSTGSATYDAARMAISMLDEERPGHKLKIHLIDSHTYSMVYGWYVCEAARKIRNGAEVAPIAAWLDSVFARAEAVLAAYSLKVMKKSGRVSAAAAFAVSLVLMGAAVRVGVFLLSDLPKEELPFETKAPLTLSDLSQTEGEQTLLTVSSGRSLLLSRLSVTEARGLNRTHPLASPRCTMSCTGQQSPPFTTFAKGSSSA